MVYKLKQGDTVPFTQVPNKALKDYNLSLKAKGMLAFMLSKPADWDFHIKGIAAELPEGKDAVRGAIDELVLAGYVTWKEIRRKGMFAGVAYTVYHTPRPEKSRSSSISNTPKEDSPDPDKPDTENPPLLIKKEQTNIVPKKELATVDPVVDYLKRGFTQVTPATMWGNWGREERSVRLLAKRLEAISPDSPETAAQQLLAYYTLKKQKEKSEFWTGAPFTPSGCLGRWDQLVEGIRREGEKMEKSYETLEWLNG